MPFHRATAYLYIFLARGRTPFRQLAEELCVVAEEHPPALRDPTGVVPRARQGVAEARGRRPVALGVGQRAAPDDGQGPLSTGGRALAEVAELLLLHSRQGPLRGLVAGQAPLDAPADKLLYTGFTIRIR